MSQNISPVAWYGGKSVLSARIVPLLPRHDTYVEAFGGGASVLFRKSPAKLEVYNDVHGGLVTFFRALRDQPEDLRRALTLTPYSRAEYEHCRDTWETVADDVERARRWYVRARQSFGASDTQGWGFEVSGAQRGGSRPTSYATSIDNLLAFAERFRRVQIEQIDWRACLTRFDHPGCVFYLDPPYHPETRGRDRRNAYAHDLDVADHEELVERVVSLQASVLISGYPHAAYDRLEDAGYERHEFAHHSSSSRALSGRGTRTEVIWRRLAEGAAESLPLFAFGVTA